MEFRNSKYDIFMFESTTHKPKQLILILLLSIMALLLFFVKKTPDRYDAKLGIQLGVPPAKALACGSGTGSGTGSGSGSCGCCTGTGTT